MSYMECEKEFVEHIASVGGVKSHGKTYENGNWYCFFDLENGERRYWTNLSEENQKFLGCYSNDYDMGMEENKK